MVVNNVVDPYPYYYGNNIVYRGDMVYVNGVPYVSASEYYRQAAELAASARDVIVVEAPPQVVVADGGAVEQAVNHQVSKPAEDWMPMGTYAIASTDANGEQVETGYVMQLAVNKEGRLRGNYYSEDAQDVRQIIGSVDSKSQRVAMQFVDDKQTVLEVGLWNLTQETAPMLIHYDENDTAQLTLIRLADPEGETSSGPNDQMGPLLPDSGGDLAP